MTALCMDYPPYYRRNFVLFMVGYISYGTALTFIGVTTVMPALAGELTSSPPLIGLVGTIFYGGWLLPQFLAARIVQGRPRQKPYLMIGVAGRIALPAIAVALWAGLARQPLFMLIVFYVCLGIFIITDAFGSIPWFDILARAIPPWRRGRLIGIAQVVTGILGIGVGVLVSLILDSPRLLFPTNYALLFGLATVALLPSTIALALLREPPTAILRVTRHIPAATRGWLRRTITDGNFSRLVICRLLVSMVELTTPFYVGHAEQVLHLPRTIIGGFVMAQTVGGIVASGILGALSERWGTHVVIRIGSLVTVLGPLFALAAHLDRSGMLGQAYPLVYIVLGVLNAIRMLGFSNYILEIAPEGMRPVYMGLANTLGSVMMVFPAIGGWLLEKTSYEVLFGISALLVGVGFVWSLRLRPTALQQV